VRLDKKSKNLSNAILTAATKRGNDHVAEFFSAIKEWQNSIFENNY
jgi:hypothetical protein